MKTTTTNKVKTLSMVLIAACTVIAITGCASAPGSSGGTPSSRTKAPIPISELYGKEWKLVEVQTPAPAESAPAYSRQELEDIGMGDAYTLTIDGERLSGKGAPNRYFGPYKAGKGQSLSIGPVAGTLMAAFKEPQGLNERAYYDYLGQVKRWDLVQGRLHLYSLNEQGQETVLIFD